MGWQDSNGSDEFSNRPLTLISPWSSKNGLRAFNRLCNKTAFTLAGSLISLQNWSCWRRLYQQFCATIISSAVTVEGKWTGVPCFRAWNVVASLRIRAVTRINFFYEENRNTNPGRSCGWSSLTKCTWDCNFSSKFDESGIMGWKSGQSWGPEMSQVGPCHL